ncbi:siroheme synthase CysG [Sulfitobacter geojensis]|uniref:siroheme synthase CysG n=1 Tax=Sulfitobacter geojensis TaxID=1342299 RepID=UPI0004694FBE|nr:siroheme synthase CysG [Sulfitobacter geojensis]KHA52462.1 Siroheme synthase [Sulfitobacter geojensis]NYI29850.1 uroporphyrin-III C-methyltransferase/precorrin-2 dehydrogenase/sirohydrochlorin ferrochelatase [Sulfitobacter geojensis]
MKTFPMFLQMAGRHVVIVGGGEQAAQKTRLMLKTEAQITVFSDVLEEELAALATSGRITQRRGPIRAAHFEHTALVFIATGCRGTDSAIHGLAKAAGATVNVVDQPALCDAITPSIVDRDPVVVAIGTEGTAPVLARQIKTRVEQMLEPDLGGLAALVGRLRAHAAQHLGPRARRDLWRWVFADTPRRTHARGAQRETARMIKQAIVTGDFGQETSGSVALVGAGPGAKDLITLRGVQRLQEADIIYYDRLVDPEILELARRDAERVYVGKRPGCHSWPQEKITQTIVAAAKGGARVVRLKCGDPGIFARGQEELDALRAADIPVEIVPGVTAACGVAAASGQMLTEREHIDTLVLTTGHVTDGCAVPQILHNLTAGTCVALYMAVRATPEISAFLSARHGPQDIAVTIVAHAQTDAEIVIHCDIASLPETLVAHGITDTATLLLKLPKAGAQKSLGHHTTPEHAGLCDIAVRSRHA